MNLKYLGLGASSTISHIPSCERDVLAMLAMYKARHHEGSCITGQVVQYVDVLKTKDILYGADHAIINFSGHGLVSDDKKTYCLWLGDEANAIECGRFIAEIVAPVAARCQAVTLLLDCCFAGRGARVAIQLKAGRTVKTIGSMNDNCLGNESISDASVMTSIDNLAVAGACGKREIAYADMRSYFSGGIGTLDTCGLSHWTFQLVNHIARAYEASSDPKSDQGTVRHVMNEVAYTSVAFLEAEDTPQWRAAAPRSLYPHPCLKVGRKHNQLIIDRLT